MKEFNTTNFPEKEEKGYEPLNEGYEPVEPTQDQEYSPPEGGSGESSPDNDSDN